MSKLTEMNAKVGVETSSNSSSGSSTIVHLPSFSPSHTLLVNAMGIRAFRFPTPDSQTEITISHQDGRIAYVSTRNRRWSGNSILSHPKAGSLIRTDYFFGPRDPVLRLLQTSSILPDEIKIKSRWPIRSAHFTMPEGTEYEWKYAREKRQDEKVKLIVLHPAGEPEARIAQLVRSKETRTPGTSRHRSGNGGQLEIDEETLQGLELTESVIVATCLVMLKREIDRRRSIQFAMMAGGGGS